MLIAPDAFKGTLSAAAAAAAIAEGWRRQRPQDHLDLCPLADGGDGFGSVLASLLDAEEHCCATVDAAGRPRQARWWSAPCPPALSADLALRGPAAAPPAGRIPPDSVAAGPAIAARLAILEVAEAIGLALLPQELRDPFALDSRGLAPLLEAAASSGAARVLLGLGGTATNDAGFGLARALGWRFCDAAGRELQAWPELERLARVLAPPQPHPLAGRLLVAVDVTNPLLGPLGASAVYGPQKGLLPADQPRAEACLQRLAASLDERDPGAAARPGSGAGGGLGFALQLFCGGRLLPGAPLVASLAGLEQRLAAADLLISGEGRFDRQSAMGKGVGRLLTLARQAGCPALLLLGQADPQALQDALAEAPPGGLRALALLPDLAAEEEARREPACCLARLAQRAAADWAV
ncbi:MAG: glycerate kinase [Synechococcaceae cyanobacterium]|nr:glycerate kinase [Synechococcaceae cyanobacterium]